MACLCLASLVACKDSAPVVSLTGEWKFALDPDDKGISEQWQSKELTDIIRLPGSLQEQGYGENVSVDTKWTGQVVDSSWYTSPMYAKYREPGNVKVPFWLNPDKHYVGAAWYQKQIEIPAGWEQKTVMLELERTHWETILFVDGKELGRQDALQVPHRYILNGLAAGTHTITLRVDNRLHTDVGMNAHSISDHTQSNWNGVIGQMTLSAKPSLYIDHVRIDPDIHAKAARVQVNLKGIAAEAGTTLTLQAKTPDGKATGSAVSLKVDAGQGSDPKIEETIQLGDDAILWSEHTPEVYSLAVTVESPDGTDEKDFDFGLREFKSVGTRFEINGQPTFLRGTLECSIFPLTGYPAMDRAYWKKIYSTCKDFGLNHVRFHSWCPPEVAFDMADSLGIYLQVECGTWTDVGSGLPQDEWIRTEAQRILQEYGNHPSFCLMVHGNEPSGANQTEYLSNLVAEWKQTDNRRVYSSSGGWPFIQNGDFWNTMSPRIQVWGAGLSSIINREAPRTDYDFASIIRTDMPTVSHEIGQWCVYPNFKEIPKYTGILKAKNFEIFQETLADKGMADFADKFLYASGRLQTLCYKADIEAALRTPGFAGFQLLDLHDFPGQGTALVGVLDPFWDTKGYVDGKEYSSFCNQTVPLIRFPKMVFTNNETIDVPLEVAHFGAKPLTSAAVNWTISRQNGDALQKGAFIRDIPLGNGTQLGRISCKLDEIIEPSQLTVSVDVEGTDIHNEWNIWVYPAVKKTVEEPYITASLDKQATDILDAGGSVLLLNYGKVAPEKGGSIAVGFSSIFWNTAWTRGQAPHTLGIYCKADHPALAAFPNEGVSDYQWWDLVSQSNAMILDEFPKGFEPVVYLIDDWFTNRKLGLVYEAKVGKGKLLVCSSDLQKDLATRPAAAQFKQSLLEYMASGNFNPTQEVDPALIKNIQ